MKISDNEIKKALKIKNAVQKYLEQTKKVNLRSTDVFPFLVRRGLYEKDYRNGLYFRQFLKKLYKANMLRSLIPQCKYVPGINGEIYGEWYFNIHRPKEVRVRIEEKIEESRIPNVNDSLSYEEAKDNLWQLIQGLNPLSGEMLDVKEDPGFILISSSLKVFIESDSSFKNEKSQEDLNVEEVEEKEIIIPPNSKAADCLTNSISQTDYIGNIRRTYSNAYNPWTKEEESLLIEFHKEKYKVGEIAKKLKRQHGAIKARLKKLGLLD